MERKTREKRKGEKRVEEVSQDEREKIREEERGKIIKEMKREKHMVQYVEASSFIFYKD